MNKKKMIKSDGNGSLVVSKKLLFPLGLVIAIVMIVISMTSYVTGLEHRIDMVEVHTDDASIHQPFEEKLEMWYTRNEGQELDAQMKHIMVIQEDTLRKLDVLLERTKKLG